VVETLDFIGDFWFFAFIGNFRVSFPDTSAITNHEQKMAFGLEWRLERVECATSSGIAPAPNLNTAEITLFSPSFGRNNWR